MRVSVFVAVFIYIVVNEPNKSGQLLDKKPLFAAVVNFPPNSFVGVLIAGRIQFNIANLSLCVVYFVVQQESVGTRIDRRAACNVQRTHHRITIRFILTIGVAYTSIHLDKEPIE